MGAKQSRQRTLRPFMWDKTKSPAVKPLPHQISATASADNSSVLPLAKISDETKLRDRNRDRYHQEGVPRGYRRNVPAISTLKAQTALVAFL